MSRRLLALALLLLPACGSTPLGALLRELGGTLEGATLSDAPFPVSTLSPDEVTVEGPFFENTGPDSFEISFTHTSRENLIWVHASLSGNHYIKELPPEEDAWSGHPDVCETYARTTGGCCTTACVEHRGPLHGPREPHRRRLRPPRGLGLHDRDVGALHLARQ